MYHYFAKSNANEIDDCQILSRFLVKEHIDKWLQFTFYQRELEKVAAKWLTILMSKDSRIPHEGTII